jgi:hypothetical protein
MDLDLNLKRIIAALSIVSLAIGCTYAAGNPDVVPPHKLGDVVQVWNGDLDGSTNANKIVTGLEGHPLPALATGALSYDGGAFYFGSSGVSPGTAGQLLATNDAGTSTTWVYPHGDVDASATDPGAMTVNAIQGVGVSTSSPSNGQPLVYNSGLWHPWALDTFETTHGRFFSGGSGSDYSAVIGPRVSNETTDAALWLLAHGVSAGANNMVLDYNGSALLFNTPGATDSIDFFNQLSAELFHVNQTVLSLDTTPLIQFGSGLSAGAIGTNKSGATFDLQMDAATTAMRLGLTGGHSTVKFFDGGSDTGANIVTIAASTLDITGPTSGILRLFDNPSGQSYIELETGQVIITQPQSGFGLNFQDNAGINLAVLKQNGSTTTTLLQSGSTITSMTMNTNDSGAFLQLGGDAAANVAKLTTTFEHQTAVFVDAVSAPGAPVSTQRAVYVDSADNKLKVQDNLGNITVLAP